MSDLLSVSDALKIIVESLTPTSLETIPTSQALGRILAEEIHAAFDLPSFSNSSMDGFAVQAGEVANASPENPAILPVDANLSAGDGEPYILRSGQAARIMTGAPIPLGCDAVVPLEQTNYFPLAPGSSTPVTVKIYNPVGAGENVRPAGQDARTGELLLQKGKKIRPQDVGIIAMTGQAEVRVYKKPRVGVFSSGDELIQLGESLSYGKIYDSNSHTLSAFVEITGGIPYSLGTAKDDFESVRACFDQAVQRGVDLIISSAGVSVGAYDFIRSVVEAYGQIHFWRVNMRPGKPVTYGAYKGVPFFGLPGNPVSAFIGFEIFVRPALARMSGWQQPTRVVQRVFLQEAVESDGRESYLRSVVAFSDGVWKAKLTGHQGSGNLRSLIQANALLLIPSGVKYLPIGAEAEAWLLDE
jgi:molybdopterin molybdotransferase